MARRSLIRMTRREWLRNAVSVAVAAAALRSARAATPDLEELRRRWRELVPAGLDLPMPTDRLELSDEQWRMRLEPLAYRVLREEATERAHTSPLNAEKRPGIYVCAGCDLPVFSSEMKYDSGTGWPSFFTTIPDAFATKRDWVLLIPRTEYHCVRCGGHHGHVFDDGPEPTGERWCNNGAALRFIAAE